MSEKAIKRDVEFVYYYYAIAAICISFYHSRMMHMANPQWINEINSFLSAFQMPLFFFIAGVLFTYTYRKGRDWKKWYAKKLVKLYVPYLILTFAAFLPKRIYYTAIGNKADLSVMSLLRSFIRPIDSIWGHLWFVPVYLLMMLLLMVYWKNVRSKWLHSLVIALSLLLSMHPLRIEWLGIRDISVELFWMLLVAELSEFVIGMDRLEIPAFAPIAAFVSAIFLKAMPWPEIFRGGVSKIVIFLMIFVVLELAIALSKRRIEVFRRIGKNTFSVYIYGWPFQAIVEAILSVRLGMPLLMVLILKFLVGISCPLLLVYAYQKYFRRAKIIGLMLGDCNE